MRLSAVLAGLAVAIAAAPSAAQAADGPRELARRYAPVVRLVEQQTKPCGHGEPFVPTNVSLVLGNPDVALRGPWSGNNLIKVAPTGADLRRGLWDYHLDFPGSALTPNCTYAKWSRRLNKGHRSLTYARVVTDSAHPGQIALQYWIFYVFNNFNDKHEGDWEMIQLDFDAPTAAQALRKPPAVVGYSQHQGGESAHWGDAKLELVGRTHPVVYAALGSHANYFTSALHLGRSAAQGVGCDDTSGPSHQVRPEVDVVPTEKAQYLRGYPWLGFEGHWGEDHSGFYNGPTGPNTSCSGRIRSPGPRRTGATGASPCRSERWPEEQRPGSSAASSGTGRACSRPLPGTRRRS
jgi:Vacuolar protein sorting-associated protein 62